MRIGLRAGHSPNCRGASHKTNGTFRDEHLCMMELYKETVTALQASGHTVINCNSNEYDARAEVREGAAKANNAGVDLFISLHMNASASHDAHGVETWIYSLGSRAYPYAQNLTESFSKLGFYNRGVKCNSNYWEMQDVDAPNIILETCFIDNEKDMKIFSPTSYMIMAKAIAAAIGKVNINFTHYNDGPQISVYDADGAETGALWNGEEFERLWVNEEGYDWYVRYYNSDKTKIKEGYVLAADTKNLHEIGVAPPKTYDVRAKKIFYSLEEAETAKSKLQELGFKTDITEM